MNVLHACGGNRNRGVSSSACNVATLHVSRVPERVGDGAPEEDSSPEWPPALGLTGSAAAAGVAFVSIGASRSAAAAPPCTLGMLLGVMRDAWQEATVVAREGAALFWRTPLSLNRVLEP